MLGAAVIAVRMLARPATIRRSGAGKWLADGTFDRDASVTQIPTKAVVQAPGASDLALLPEGETASGKVVIWCETELQVSDEATGQEADRLVTEHGQTFKIIAVKNRSEAGFWRAIGSEYDDRGRSL